MAEWQTIDTAPKDGSSILVWNGQWTQISWWTNAYVGMDGYADGWFEDVADEVARVFYDYPGSDPTLPTHWMPLPPPPAIASAPKLAGEVSGE